MVTSCNTQCSSAPPQPEQRYNQDTVHKMTWAGLQAHQKESKSKLQTCAYFSSLTVNKRDKEIDVSVGDLRMAILIQVIAAEEFHWPVLRQKPSDTNITGILGG